MATVTRPEQTPALDKKLFTLWLNPDEKRRLAEYAARNDLRSAQVVRKLIRQLPDSAIDDPNGDDAD